MNELISIIVPVYNVARYLPDCIQSIQAQTYTNLEIILVDDGSTDESGSICDEWKDKDDRIQVIHKENGGASSARNMGLDAATGSLIGFVDGDDWIEPDMYEALVHGLGDADMACCGYFSYPLDTMDKAVKKGIKPVSPCAPVEAVINLYERDSYFTAIWNKLFRREAIMTDKRILYLDTDLTWGEDEVWLAQVLNKCQKVVFIPQALYHWRPTVNSATRNKYVSKRQMTLFTAKIRAMKLLPQDEKVQNLVKARMYNDCYSLKVLAYTTEDWNNYKEISAILSPLKSVWMKSYDITTVRKIKVQLLEMEMKTHMPGRIVLKTDNIVRYGIKK